MIQMCVREKYRVECSIGRGRRSVQRFGFFAALKLTGINQDPRLFCLNDITRTGDFAANRSNESDFHLDEYLVIFSRLIRASLLDFRLTN